MKSRETVATNLRRLRQAAGLSQEDLADSASTDRHYVGKLEREENSPTTDMLDKLAAVLAVDPIEFFRRG
jgi:transcriptional regulator with XRE-family HTH domain